MLAGYRDPSPPADKIVPLDTAVSIEPGGAAALGAVPSLQATHSISAPPRTRWWVEVLAIAWILWLYDAITNLAPLRLGIALQHAHDVLHLEQTLGIDPERSLDRWLAGHHSLGLALSDYYDNAHFVVTLSLLAWLWWRRADLYRPLRNSLVLVNLLAFIVFWRYPVAPPRMLPGFTDVVTTTGAIGSWHTGALASHANELAAMPSLHMAWAVWCTVAVWRLTQRVWARALAVIYPCLTAVAVLATGNHFVLDILGGLLAIAAALLISALLDGRDWQLRGRLPTTAHKLRFLAKSGDPA